MTVGQLIEQLKNEDPGRLVVLQRDPEGNGFSPCYSCWAGAYDDGEVGFEELTEELMELGYAEEDCMAGGIPALIFVPTD